MLDFFAEDSIARQLLTLGGITIVMSQLATWHPWIAGLSTFLVLMILMAIVALRGDPRATAVLAGVAALLGTGVCWFEGSDLSSSLAFVVSLLGTGSLASLSVIVCLTSRHRLRKINELEAQQSELLRKVYDYDRSACAGGDVPLLPLNATTPSSSSKIKVDPAFGQVLSEMVNPRSSSILNPDVFDFAMLLLSMQQIGHRLSSELELDALVAAILGTSKEVLRCQSAELHLWNARDGRFSNAAPGGSISMANSVKAISAQASPRPPAFEWVRTQQRILTRRDVAAGKVGAPELISDLLPTAIAPLLVGSDLVGLLIVDETDDEGPTFVRMLHILANHCALSLKNAQLFRHIDEMARRDSLTGLLNHASFLDELERAIDEATVTGQTLTVVMSDLDHFKSFNDNFGHQAGDKVLQEVARWWKAIMPDHAVLARYGGEEFICALPGEDLERGEQLAEMLRASLVSNPVSHHGMQMRVTASFGVAELGRPADNATRLIRLADKALYRAKADGRNCVETHDPETPRVAAMDETAQFTLN